MRTRLKETIMYNRSSIIKIENINEYKINEQIKESLKYVYWRIESNHYHDLIAEIEGQTIKNIGVSWGNPNHPLAKYIHLSSNATQEMLKKMLILQAPYDRIIFSCWKMNQKKLSFCSRFHFNFSEKHIWRNMRLALY